MAFTHDDNALVVVSLVLAINYCEKNIQHGVTNE